MKIFFKYCLLPLLLILLIGGGGAYYYVNHWLHTPVHVPNHLYDFRLEKGDSIAHVLHKMQDDGVDVNPRLFLLYARWTKQDTLIKAGAYEIKEGDTPQSILTKMASGQMSQRRITLIDGWTSQQFLKALAENKDLKQTIPTLTQAQILKQLGSQEDSLEGLFFPDTYVFVPGDTDMDVLKRAYHEGQERLQQAWDNRDSDLPLKTPYELLILASIVEKETGHAMDRGMVAGVFVNRLKKDMLLQTDPTVIYGMGDRYQGNLRKVDLQTDTPWNTYTRKGLPPTPIANPSQASLQAASHPTQHDYLYFVSRGDGSSEFATSLSEHNQNVQKFILKKKDKSK